MKKYAVLIGINYFGSESELRGCIADVRNVWAVLVAKGYECTILHDGEVSVFPEAGVVHRPTADNIRKVLSGVMAKTVAGDQLYVHYSGHGSQLPDQNGDERDGEDECICPVDFDFNKRDAGFIRDDELNSILVKKDVTLIAVFDCCHSGSGLDFPYRWVAGKAFIQDYPRKPRNATPGYFFSGCQDVQTSADATIDGLPSGALTWAFLKTLKEMGKSKVPYSWKEMLELVRYKLKRGGYDQVPQLCLMRKEDLDVKVSL